MPTVLLPPVPYDRTSLRPAWDDLPQPLRNALRDRLGADVTRVQPTATGFTSGFAALLTTADGSRHFIKAADLASPTAGWYRREAQLTAALPPGVPAARPLWHDELAGHFVLCLAPIDDPHTPTLPWSPAELQAALDAHAAAAQALSHPSPTLLALHPSTWGTVIDDSLRNWRDATAPPHPRAADLAALETRFDNLTRHATTLTHCDLRLDNVVIDAAGQAWLCDWNHLCFGPPWFDTMTLLLSAEASALDPDALFTAHPTTAGLPQDALDAALAAIAGFYLSAGAQPEVETSPALRGHQRFYGKLTLRWLSRRQGWPEPH